MEQLEFDFSPKPHLKKVGKFWRVTVGERVYSEAHSIQMAWMAYEVEKFSEENRELINTLFIDKTKSGEPFRHPCLYDTLDSDKGLGLACTCPKCSPWSAVNYVGS